MKRPHTYFIALAMMMLFAGGCQMAEQIYDKVSPDEFFTNKESIYAMLRSPFEFRAHSFNELNYWFLQELTTDEMAAPARASDFYDNGFWIRLHRHTWSTEDVRVGDTYTQTNYIIANALVAQEALSEADYIGLGLTEADKRNHLNQIKTVLAYAYMRALDLFGGMPIYTRHGETLKPRNTRRETFEYIETLLKESIPGLTCRESLEQHQDGYVYKGAAAMLLAKLYLNAIPYIGEDRYEDAEKILQDIYDNKYGVYALDPTWWGPFCFDNHESPEAMWYVPSANSRMQFRRIYTFLYPYNAKIYFDCGLLGRCNNGIQLSPSLESPGVPYTTKLGRPYAKFNERDLRKKPYAYKGDGLYEGMFLVGLLKNSSTGEICKGTKMKNGQPIDLVDYVNYSGSKSDMLQGDENSGIRLVKLPVPDKNDKLRLYDPDYPDMRFTEVVYNLAECRWRRGDMQGAADLINSVRRRNFENGADPDPVTPSNLDLYRLADEYMIEFIGEGRRRTDLIRWGLFTSGSWWDKEPSPDTRNVFCIPSSALYANPLMEQNPGY